MVVKVSRIRFDAWIIRCIPPGEFKMRGFGGRCFRLRSGGELGAGVKRTGVAGDDGDCMGVGGSIRVVGGSIRGKFVCIRGEVVSGGRLSLIVIKDAAIRLRHFRTDNCRNPFRLDAGPNAVVEITTKREPMNNKIRVDVRSNISHGQLEPDTICLDDPATSARNSRDREGMNIPTIRRKRESPSRIMIPCRPQDDVGWVKQYSLLDALRVRIADPTPKETSNPEKMGMTRWTAPKYLSHSLSNSLPISVATIDV